MDIISTSTVLATPGAFTLYRDMLPDDEFNTRWTTWQTWVQGVGFRVREFEFRVQGLGFGV